MPTEPTIVRQPQRGGSWKGLDLRNSRLNLDPDSLTYALNVEATQDGGSLATRDGTSWIAHDIDPDVNNTCKTGLGVFSHVYQTSTGTKVSEILTAGETLARKTSNSFVITYTGPAAQASAQFLASATNANPVFTLLEDGVVTATITVSRQTTTVSSLRASIDALANFSCSALTVAGDISFAEYIPRFGTRNFTTDLLTVSWDLLEKIPTGSSSVLYPFTDSFDARELATYEGMSSASLNQCIYFQDGITEEYKYDGERVYRSGMPQATIASGPSLSGTGVTGTNISYLLRFVQKDERGNLSYGIISDASATTSPANQSVSFTYNRIDPSLGFKTDNAVVNGAQVGVTTITVDAGHTFQIGETVYFRDRSVAFSFVERTITNTTATTITISGAVVNVNDNDIISLNLRVQLYRKTSAASDYFLVAEFPHDGTTATPTITDTGTALGESYVSPLPGTEPGLPPKGKYLTVYRGMKWVSGILDNPDRVAFSDISNPEAYAPDEEACGFQLRSGNNYPVTGIFGSQEYLAIFKENSISVLTGAVTQEGYFRYQIDPYSTCIGTNSHASIQQIPTGEIYFLHRTGIYSILGRGGLTEISKKIAPFFDVLPESIPEGFSYKLVAKAYVNVSKSQYVVSVTLANLDVLPGTYSDYLICCDLYNLTPEGLPAIYIWDSYDFMGGVAIDLSNDRVYFTPYPNVGISRPTYQFQYPLVATSEVAEPYCYADHDASIDSRIITGHLDGGQSSVFKTLQKSKIFATDPGARVYGTMSVSLLIDFRFATAAAFNVDLESSQSIPTNYVDLAVPGTLNPVEQETALPRFKCVAFQYSISQESHIYDSLLVTAIETEVLTPYNAAMKE